MKNLFHMKFNTRLGRQIMTLGIAAGLVAVMGIGNASCTRGSSGGSRTPSLGLDIPGLFDAAEKSDRANKPVTVTDEYYIGRAITANMIDRYGLYMDRTLTKYVNMVGSTFIWAVPGTPSAYGGYHFLILNTDEPMAFATPGAYIMISKGLIKACKNEDQLAGILAHEVGHLRAQHAKESIEEARQRDAAMAWGSWGLNLAAGASGNNIAQMTAAFANSIDDLIVDLYEKGYNQDQEREADKIGVQLMKKVGYDPKEFVNMMSTVFTDDKSSKMAVTSSHPTTAERLGLMNAEIGNYKSPKPASFREARFNDMKARIK